MRIKDEFAGRKVRCSGCKAVLVVPKPDVDREAQALDFLMDDSSGEERVSPAAIQARPPAPARPPANRPAPSPAPAPPRPIVYRPVKEKRKRQPRVTFEEGWFGSMNAGVIGGILMMGIAVAWFVAGLMGGIIFFYPPILLVVGFIAMIKGIMGGGD
jgi:predicted lipid-binding transport protein (Tim44 family)